MNNLWIYGCSFSEPFGLEVDTPFSLDFASGIRDFKGVSYWGTYLANHLGYHCISKGTAGRGWNYINYRIDQDILKWNTNDIIIISPSIFSRIDIIEFEPDKNPIISRNPEFKCHDMMRPIDELTEENKERWKIKVGILQKVGFHIYTWCIDECQNIEQMINLIPAPNNSYNWQDWIYSHKEYWLDVERGDYHFNDNGHKQVANQMYNFIIKNDKR
jgi:hypothetical protein